MESSYCWSGRTERNISLYYFAVCLILKWSHHHFAIPGYTQNTTMTMIVALRLSSPNLLNDVIGPGQTDDGTFTCCDCFWKWYSVLIYDFKVIICCPIVICGAGFAFIYCDSEPLALHEHLFTVVLYFRLTYGVSYPSWQSHPKIYYDTDVDWFVFIFIESVENNVCYFQADCTFLPAGPLGCYSPF